MVEDFKFGVEAKGAEMSGLSEVVSFRENDVMFGKGKLHIALTDGEDVTKTRALQLLEEDLHAG